MPSSPLGSTTQSNNVGHGMKSPPLDSTHGRTTSGMTCHHRRWTAHTVERRRAWHAIITFGKHKRSDDIRRCMPSLTLDGKRGRMMSGVECHHLLWAAHTVERHWAWHDIIAFGQLTRSYEVGRDMPSLPLDSTHGRTSSATSGVA